jgi:hypothetical protein
VDTVFRREQSNSTDGTLTHVDSSFTSARSVRSGISGPQQWRRKAAVNFSLAFADDKTILLLKFVLTLALTFVLARRGWFFPGDSHPASRLR